MAIYSGGYTSEKEKYPDPPGFKLTFDTQKLSVILVPLPI